MKRFLLMLFIAVFTISMILVGVGYKEAAETVTQDKFAFSSYHYGSWEIYLVNIGGSEQLRLTNNNADDWSPNFLPDMSKIVFESNRDGNSEIYIMNVDGSKQINLTDNPADDTFISFSSDGSKIFFLSNRDGKYEIYKMDVDGSNQVKIKKR